MSSTVIGMCGLSCKFSTVRRRRAFRGRSSAGGSGSRSILKRRAERALARIAALEQQPARLAGVIATAGSAVAVLAVALGGL
uniref:hypothetical protein n=1 Tax=Curtobacterium sp. ME26 TaxID=2744254 RepID=UPI001C7125AB